MECKRLADVQKCLEVKRKVCWGSTIRVLLLEERVSIRNIS